MKFLLTTFLALLFLSFTIGSYSSCKDIHNSTIDTVYIERVQVVHDTIKVVNSEREDSLAITLLSLQDSIKFYRDSIRYEDYINARRIEKIRYYISICEKKPTNKKFFFGWIRRTMTE